jgi:type II secretory pathway pseudopilin PulG
MPTVPAKPIRRDERGFMLVGLIVAIFLILLVLGIAAPRVAKELRRDRELEAVHRGNQYVRAVQLYYRKVGHYPGSMEQLEKTNNIRFLRQRYVDPMTGKTDWKLIHVGEAKTTVKGFFGKPLSGLPGAGGLGSAAGMATSGAAGAGAVGSSGSGSSSTFGSSSFGSSGGSGSSLGSSSGSTFGSSSGSSGSTFGSSSTGSPTPSTGGIGAASTASSGVSSQSATSFTGTGAPIMGVGTAATGSSIVVLNEQTTYPTWEFIYDPRIEQLKAKTNLLGGGVSSTSASGFGAGSTPGTPGSLTTPGSTGTGSSSSGFGSSSFGSSGSTTPAPAAPTTPQ